MKCPVTILLSIMLGAFAASCKKQEVESKNVLSLEVHRDSITDFSSFLEGISHLVSEQPVTLQLPGGQPDRKLMFWRSGGPGCPVLVHVSPDAVALESGTDHSSMTLEQLGSSMRLLKEAAKSADTHGIILLVSDRHVSGEFGLSILELLADCGIDFIALVEPDRHEETTPAGSDSPKPKPSSPRKSEYRIIR